MVIKLKEKNLLQMMLRQDKGKIDAFMFKVR